MDEGSRLNEISGYAPFLHSDPCVIRDYTGWLVSAYRALLITHQFMGIEVGIFGALRFSAQDVSPVGCQ